MSCQSLRARHRSSAKIGHRSYWRVSAASLIAVAGCSGHRHCVPRDAHRSWSNLVLRSSKAVGEAAAILTRCRWWAPPDPGRGAVIESGRGTDYGVVDVGVIGEGLAGEGLFP